MWSQGSLINNLKKNYFNNIISHINSFYFYRKKIEMHIKNKNKTESSINNVREDSSLQSQLLFRGRSLIS